ncbi:hypothetical protein I317_02555 [Kwoniella heveanensis CBS 569]|uniref:Transmembrane protein n=1 Tax=Kwoniella heveanensis BCC8398 TaxID=1296120 RepID=A0A1B9GHE3_9TREE|nr:hypothetical protein I316_07925 [Kwoniella heveanensis BCC8398]OCF43538.1 hypothetical protein I317_02555 [Kwoniella heveanensis CBS 569]
MPPPSSSSSSSSTTSPRRHLQHDPNIDINKYMWTTCLWVATTLFLVQSAPMIGASPLDMPAKRISSPVTLSSTSSSFLADDVGQHPQGFSDDILLPNSPDDNAVRLNTGDSDVGGKLRERYLLDTRAEGDASDQGEGGGGGGGGGINGATIGGVVGAILVVAALIVFLYLRSRGHSQRSLTQLPQYPHQHQHQIEPHLVLPPYPSPPKGYAQPIPYPAVHNQTLPRYTGPQFSSAYVSGPGTHEGVAYPAAIHPNSGMRSGGSGYVSRAVVGGGGAKTKKGVKWGGVGVRNY